MPRAGASLVALAALLSSPSTTAPSVVQARLADRSRVVKARGGRRDNNNLAIEGGAYRGARSLSASDAAEAAAALATERRASEGGNDRAVSENPAADDANERVLKTNARADGAEEAAQPSSLRGTGGSPESYESPERFSRRLSSQLTGCCYTYADYGAADMCALYGQDCESGETPSHDSGDESCSQDGLSFIGISFSVNTASGNPYSYQLCDQFPMENIIDRNYDYVMSMDEDGWLVGGGYKSFDYSGKMP